MLQHHYRYVERRKDPSGKFAAVGKLVHGVIDDAFAWRRSAKGRRWGIPMVASLHELLHLLEHQPAQLVREKEIGSCAEISMQVMEEAREIVAMMAPFDFAKTWAVEHGFTLRLSHTMVVGGFIDWIEVEGNPPVVVTITDFKSGVAPVMDEHDLYYDPQAGLYLVWARLRWPHAREIRFRLWNVRNDEDTWLRWSPQLDERHVSYARTMRNQYSAGDTTPTVGRHCRYCPYREGDRSSAPCHAYVAHLDNAKIDNTDMDGESAAKGGLDRLDLPPLMRLYQDMKLLADLSDSRRKDLAQAILRKLPDGQKSYSYGDLRVTRVSKRQKRFDSPLLFLRALSEMLGVDVVDLIDQLCAIKQNELNKIQKVSEKDKQIKRLREEHQSLSLSSEYVQLRRMETMF